MMIWATLDEVTARWEPGWPPLPDNPVIVQARIDTARRALRQRVIRWPRLDDTTDRPADDEVRAAVVEAIVQTVRGILLVEQTDGATAGATQILAAGGSISADNLSISGGRGARVDETAMCQAEDALLDACMIGGAVPTW